MPSRAFPVTPPCIRVRTRRFGWLYGWPSRQRRESERDPVGIRQGIAQSGAFAEPPGAVATASGLRRQVLADASLTQLAKTHASQLPLLTDDASQTPPDPRVQVAKHRERFAVGQIALPAAQIPAEVRDPRRDPHAPSPPRFFPHSPLAAR